jgi:hypothetical protein
MALEDLSDHDAVLDTPDGGVCVPAGKSPGIEDLLVAGMFVEIVGRGIVKLGHAGELLAVRACLGLRDGRRFERGRYGLG